MNKTVFEIATIVADFNWINLLISWFKLFHGTNTYHSTVLIISICFSKFSFHIVHIKYEIARENWQQLCWIETTMTQKMIPDISIIMKLCLVYVANNHCWIWPISLRERVTIQRYTKYIFHFHFWLIYLWLCRSMFQDYELVFLYILL